MAASNLSIGGQAYAFTSNGRYISEASNADDEPRWVRIDSKLEKGRRSVLFRMDDYTNDAGGGDDLHDEIYIVCRTNPGGKTESEITTILTDLSAALVANFTRINRGETQL